MRLVENGKNKAAFLGARIAVKFAPNVDLKKRMRWNVAPERKDILETSHMQLIYLACRRSTICNSILLGWIFWWKWMLPREDTRRGIYWASFVFYFRQVLRSISLRKSAWLSLDSKELSSVSVQRGVINFQHVSLTLWSHHDYANCRSTPTPRYDSFLSLPVTLSLSLSCSLLLSFFFSLRDSFSLPFSWCLCSRAERTRAHDWALILPLWQVWLVSQFLHPTLHNTMAILTTFFPIWHHWFFIFFFFYSTLKNTEC